MKTLNKYTVNGGLFAGDGVTPVTVADQVKLYLDTEAHPGFPEFIVGTIQHPVAPLNGGSVISYSFEYDEADLLGEVAHLIVADVVSVEFQNAGGELTTETLLDTVENLTAPEQATFRSEIGVNAENVLALLEGEVLEIQGTVYENTDSVALPAGVWGWNASYNSWVRHDGSTVGGVPVYLEDSMRIRGSLSVLESAIASATTFHELGRIPVTSAQAVAGKHLHVKGTISGTFVSNAGYIGIKVMTSSCVAASTEGWLLGLDTTSAFARYELDLRFPFLESGGVLTVGVPTTNSISFIRATRTVGTVSTSLCGEESADSFTNANEGIVATAQEIIIGVYVDSSGSANPGFLAFDSDLQCSIN